MSELTEPGKYYSPWIKKGMAKAGESLDALGKAAIGLAGLSSIHLDNNNAFLVDLHKIGPLQCVAAVVGLFLIVVGTCWQAEAER